MLTNSTFAGLTNLEGLNLANNDLLDIRADNFHMLKLLTRLDLSHNFIKVMFTSTNTAVMLKVKGRHSDSFDFTGCPRSLPSICAILKQVLVVSLLSIFSEIAPR